MKILYKKHKKENVKTWNKSEQAMWGGFPHVATLPYNLYTYIIDRERITQIDIDNKYIVLYRS